MRDRVRGVKHEPPPEPEPVMPEEPPVRRRQRHNKRGLRRSLQGFEDPNDT